MTTNQPTDATRFKTALYAQCPEPVADDIWQRFESLTLQLATAQAQAKAWEEWGVKLEKQLEPFANQKNWGGGSKFELNHDGDEIITTGFFHTYEGYKPWYNARRVLLSKPQPANDIALAGEG